MREQRDKHSQKKNLQNQFSEKKTRQQKLMQNSKIQFLTSTNLEVPILGFFSSLQHLNCCFVVYSKQ